MKYRGRSMHVVGARYYHASVAQSITSAPPDPPWDYSGEKKRILAHHRKLAALFI